MSLQPLRPGDKMPAFHVLPGVDGRSYSSSDFSTDVLIIVFSCNHCPYVQAYEERMITLQRDYDGRAQLVAINANDEKNYPDDSFQAMVVRHREKHMNYAYLRDASQEAATAYGATHTPQFFVFDKERILQYSGKFDDNWKEPEKISVQYVRDALDAILTGRKVETAETYSIGCTIKWKSA